LIAYSCRGDERDRDAARDQRNLDEVKLTSALRASFDEAPEASFLKRRGVGKTGRHAGEKNENFRSIGEAGVLRRQTIEPASEDVIHQDDDQRETEPKIDLRNTPSL
jgi:hypothetical protein